LGVQKLPGGCRIPEPIFTVFLGGLPPRPASASIGTELRCSADTATIPPLGDNGTATPTATLGSRFDPDLGHKTQVVLTLAIAALAFRRAAAMALGLVGPSAVGALNPNTNFALPPIPRFECDVGIRTDFDAW
jgi:hypothetical protein